MRLRDTVKVIESWVLPVVLLSGCTTAPDPAPEPPPTATHPAEPSTPLQQRLEELVSAHHEVDGSWLGQATVVAVARLQTGSYPCIFHEDGSSDMPMSHTFAVEEVVVRGSLGRETVDLAPPGTPSTRWPHELRDGRRYLLFLNPSPDSAALLAREDEMFGVYTQLHEPEIVAIVDLDATAQDIRAQREAAATHLEREAYVLDRTRWEALRRTGGVEPRELMATLHALRTDHFPGWRTRTDAFATLGQPDQGSKEGADTIDTYFANRQDANTPAEGRFVARIELVSGPDGTLIAYREEFLVGRDGNLEVASYDEKKAAGLMWTHIERR